MTRALVTGGTGFVGANLARRLLSEGHEVHLLVRPEHDPWRIEEIRDDTRIHAAALADEEAVSRAVLAARPEWIFHLAAHGAYSWQSSPREILSTNLGGTATLLDTCVRLGFGAFVNTGSSSEYGFQDHAPTETERLEPNSHYAISKAAATQLCRFVARSSRVNVVTLRLYSVYGPWEEPRRFLPTLIREGLKGRLPPLVDPATARDFVHVDDVVEAYLLAARVHRDEPGAIYNVGSGSQTTVQEAVEVARRILGIREPPRWGTMPGRVWDTTVWVADPSKVRRELGWTPRTSFEDGFRRMVATFPRTSRDVSGAA